LETLIGESASRRTNEAEARQHRQYMNELRRPANERNIQRNDFSSLGIFNNDSASSNGYEMRQLKSEMKELKNLMKLSFDLQLDMQRAFKQEISALISNASEPREGHSLLTASNAYLPIANHFNTTKSSHNGKCIICIEKQIDCVFYKCGHMCVSIISYYIKLN
jgi:hypothetical protein